jgi:hypothetical protein
MAGQDSNNAMLAGDLFALLEQQAEAVEQMLGQLKPLVCDDKSDWAQ